MRLHVLGILQDAVRLRLDAAMMGRLPAFESKAMSAATGMCDDPAKQYGRFISIYDA